MAFGRVVAGEGLLDPGGGGRWAVFGTQLGAERTRCRCDRPDWRPDRRWWRRGVSAVSVWRVKRGGAAAKGVKLVGPEKLVALEGHRYGRDARSDGGGGRAGAAVVDDCGHAREEPVVRNVVDTQGSRGQGDVAEVTPAGEEEAALAGALERLEVERSQGVGRAAREIAAKTNVDGRRAVLQELDQRGVRLPASAGAAGTRSR